VEADKDEACNALQAHMHAHEQTHASTKGIDTQADGSSAHEELEQLQHKLKAKDKAMVKLQKEHKRLQVMAAGRSPAALRSPAAW